MWGSKCSDSDSTPQFGERSTSTASVPGNLISLSKAGVHRWEGVQGESEWLTVDQPKGPTRRLISRLTITMAPVRLITAVSFLPHAQTDESLQTRRHAPSSPIHLRSHLRRYSISKTDVLRYIINVNFLLCAATTSSDTLVPLRRARTRTLNPPLQSWGIKNSGKIPANK